MFTSHAPYLDVVVQLVHRPLHSADRRLDRPRHAMPDRRRQAEAGFARPLNLIDRDRRSTR
jgi:hypothetical protein